VAHAYPILLELAGRLVVIVGGGKVAVRKARGVIDGGADGVRCIALEINSEMPSRVERIVGAFEPSHLDGAGLAFAATNSPEVNTAVVRASRERGILVCRADADEEDGGDFTVPAVWRSGSVVVGVSAGSPALSAALRDEIRNISGLGKYLDMAEVLKALRPRLREMASLSTSQHMQAMRDLVTQPALDVLAKDGAGALWRWLVDRFPELKGEKAP
jgi:precorrin-2 dehydrogenase/sirohydrochlorin ferrochelatase